MNVGSPVPLSLVIESLAGCTASAFRLFAVNVALARNFQGTQGLPPAEGALAGRGDPVIEIERDGRIGIDLKFGSIAFKEEAHGTYAVALVDVIVAAADMAPDSDTRVQMNVRVAADPDRDSILDVTERLRSHIVKTLRAAADTLDAASARALLFYVPEGS